jgi:membrane protease YdiL (CAAX protease family)
MVLAKWMSRELDSQRAIRDDRPERVRPGLARRLAQLVLAALVLALPAEVIFGQPAGTGVRYALSWLTLAGGGILLVRIGSPGSSRDWLAHRSWMAGLLVVVMLVFSAGVLGGSLLPPASDTANRLIAGLAIMALAAVLNLGLIVPALRRHGGIVLASAPLAWAVMSYTLMYACGSGLSGMVRSALHAELGEVQPGAPLWLLAGGVSIELVMLLCIVALVPTSGGRAGLRELGLRGLPLERVVLVGVAVAGLTLMSEVGSTLLGTQLGIDPALLSNVPRLQAGALPSLGQVIVADAVAPGIVEELFFRGVLFGLLVRAQQPLWLAVFVSSGLFAVGHLTPDMTPVQMVGVGVPIFISGSLFAATYRLTGSLLPGMLAHVLNDLPIAVGLALGPDAKGSVGAVVVTVSVFAWLLLGSSAAREYRGRALTARNGLERLSAAILTHLSPRARLGVVEILPVRHLALVAGAWLVGAALLLPDPGGFSVLVYGLFQGGRLVSEGARTAMALACGGTVVHVRLSPLLHVDFSEDVRPQRGTAAAGIAARIALGLALVGAASTLGATWPAARQETVTFVGWLYVEGSLLSLLPLSGADFEGPLLWGRSWTVRPSWLPYPLAVLLGIGCAGLTAIEFPTGYLGPWLAEFAQPAPLVLVGVWVATSVVVMSRLKLLAPKPPEGRGMAAITGSPAGGEGR